MDSPKRDSATWRQVIVVAKRLETPVNAVGGGTPSLESESEGGPVTLIGGSSNWLDDHSSVHGSHIVQKNAEGIESPRGPMFQTTS